jgi:hypothetical protein
MTKVQEQIGIFVKNIFEDNYSEAKVSLQNAVTERIKEKMSEQMKDEEIISKGE